MPKILITGSNGMVGQNLLHSSFPSSYSILAPSKDELNLLHFDSVIQWFRKNKPDGVIHAAGIVGGIQANINSPIKFFSENMSLSQIFCPRLSEREKC